jgi:hypothetical protein
MSLVASLESPSALYRCLRWSKRLILDSEVEIADVGSEQSVAVGLVVLHTLRVAEGTRLGLATRGRLLDISLSCL